jgi:UDP-glucose-4-epimerase GalE
MSDGRAVLVTGGAGYIGSQACKALAKRGHLPIALDNLVNGRREFVKWGPLVVADIADEPAVRSAVQQYGARSVIHFAAYAEVEQSMREPALYYDNNLARSVSFANALRQEGVERLVFSSSCAVYGAPARQPVDESERPEPISPYGESKLGFERLLQAYDRAYGFRSVSLRYFNAAGADLEGELGEWPRIQTRLIPRVLQAAMGLLPEIVIYGQSHPTRDGTAVRDYVHVEDVVQAHLQALDYLAAGGSSTQVNLGTGTGHSVREIVVAAERIAGRSIPRRFAPPRPGDPPELVADVRKASQLLGWRPTRSDLDTIMRSAWSWQRKISATA